MKLKKRAAFIIFNKRFSYFPNPRGFKRWFVNRMITDTVRNKMVSHHKKRCIYNWF